MNPHSFYDSSNALRQVRVAVTGSAGRVGRAIVVGLAREHVAVGLDRFPASTAVAHVGDVCDRDLLARAFDGCDAVIHVAALHAPHVGIVADREFERVNVEGTAAVVDTARAAGVRRLVLTSTTALYGQTGWIDEHTEPRARTIYHRTKLAAEQIVRASGLPAAIIRMSRCFPEPADVMAVYRLHRGIDARDVAAAHVLGLAREGTFVISGTTPFQRGDVDALAHAAPAVIRERAPELARVFEALGWPLPAAIDRVYDSAHATRARLAAALRLASRGLGARLR
jgi:nucleoside-diphosphate-sugar epimerase